MTGKVHTVTKGRVSVWQHFKIQADMLAGDIQFSNSGNTAKNYQRRANHPVFSACMLPHRARDDYFFSWIGGILSFLGSGGFLLFFLITPPYNCGFILKEFPRNFGFFYIIPVPFPKTWSQAFFFLWKETFLFCNKL